MSVSSIALAGLAPPAAQPTAQSSPFDGEAFMKLLLAQLKHQDPLNPLQDNEFLGQLAQMNALAELQKLNASIEMLSRAQSLAQGASLIGKRVQAAAPGGAVTQGLVGAVRLNGSEVLLDLGATTVRLADVQAVQEVSNA